MVITAQPTKKNSVVKNTWAEKLENRYYRKTIENTFADITAKFPRKSTLISCSTIFNAPITSPLSKDNSKTIQSH